MMKRWLIGLALSIVSYIGAQHYYHFTRVEDYFNFSKSFYTHETNVPTVHVIGDSHAKASFSNLSTWNSEHYEQSSFMIHEHKINCQIHWLTSVTMHRVGRDGIKLIDIRKMAIKNGDTVVFVFGEIDVRCHIGKQRDEKKRSLDEIIQTLVTKYVNTIKTNHAFVEGIQVAILGILPPTNQVFNASVPYYGTLSDRIAITQMLNKSLQDACTQHDIVFVDIYNYFVTPQGDLNGAMSDGLVHVNLIYNYIIKQRLVELVYPQLVL